MEIIPPYLRIYQQILKDLENALPFLNVPQILVEASLSALRNIALWKRENFKGKVVAIAGSAGKTTTKEMTAF